MLAAVAFLPLTGAAAPRKHDSGAPAKTGVTSTDGVAMVAPMAALTALDSARIVLNRLAYGPRPGDVERVAAMGAMRWVDAQISPGADLPREQLEDGFEIYHLGREELASRLLQERDERRAGKADTSRHATSPAMNEMRELNGEFQQLAVARAVVAETQLREVLCDFWINHFNVFLGKNDERALMPSYVEEAIRPHALGRFEDLLIATAQSPAMMVYLDNAQSVAKGAIPPEVARAEMRSAMHSSPRVDSLLARMESRMPTGINENYARELFELHTLGVDGGYTQKDVDEAARVLTGWSAEVPARGGSFIFREWAHDRGEKTVLGVKFPAGRGQDEGIALLKMLARHPATMQHVTTQLCQRLIGDDPPAGAIEAGVAAWRASDGSIRDVVHAIVMSPEFWQAARARAKFKTPLEFMVSSLRAVGGAVNTDPGPAHAVGRLGQPLYLQPVPTGYQESEAAWANSAALFERMNVAVALAAGKLPGVAVNLDAVVPISTDPDTLVERVDRTLLSGAMSPRTAEVIRREIAGLPPDKARALAAGLGLGGPDFQMQ
jgi:uncharacterized protein (DUF1800 family)